MGVRLILKDGFIKALLSGEFDHHVARELREEIDGTAMRTRPSVLKLDFSGVQFMDSSGIGLIMGRYKLMQTWGGNVTIANLPPKLEKIVSLSGLRDLCSVVKEVKEVEGEE